MADSAEGLEVVQGALPPPTVDRPDVVHLPEVALHWVTDHLIQLGTRTHTHTHTRSDGDTEISQGWIKSMTASFETIQQVLKKPNKPACRKTNDATN